MSDVCDGRTPGRPPQRVARYGLAMRRKSSRNGSSQPGPTLIFRSRTARPLGLRDPAYIADTPHDLWTGIQRQEPYRATLSAAELEAWIRQAPPVDQVLAGDMLGRQRYDDGGRLVALLLLRHLERHPQDARLPEVMRREVEKAEPRLAAVGLSTAQWAWALAAAQRVRDGHENDG